MSITQEQWVSVNNVNYEMIYRVFSWLANKNENEIVEIDNKYEYEPMTTMNTPPSTPIIQKDNKFDFECVLIDKVLYTLNKKYDEIAYQMSEWLSEGQIGN